MAISDESLPLYLSHMSAATFTNSDSAASLKNVFQVIGRLLLHVKNIKYIDLGIKSDGVISQILLHVNEEQPAPGG